MADEINTNIIRIGAPIQRLSQNWVDYAPLISEWALKGEIYGCGSFSPLESSINLGERFQQERECSQAQSRTVQFRQYDSVTGEIKAIGSPEVEDRSIIVADYRSTYGTLENWQAADPIASEWRLEASAYDCTNWSPAASTQAQGKSFIQTATNCKRDRVRDLQEREMELNTGQYRNNGLPKTETEILSGQQSTRTATGTYVSEWESLPPSSTVWYTTGTVPFNCGGWEPSTSEYPLGSEFSQHQQCSLTAEKTTYYKRRNIYTGQIVDSRPPYVQQGTTTTWNFRKAIGTRR